MAVSLVKHIERGTWRYIGLLMKDIAVGDIPIAGRSIGSIVACLNGTLYRLPAVPKTKLFAVKWQGCWLVYVDPRYTGYRNASARIFTKADWKVDYDHVLSRNIAMKLGFRYVLIARIPPGVNRSHGSAERDFDTLADEREVLYLDRRTADKLVGRRVGLFPRMAGYRRYNPNVRVAQGFTLKQMGKLGWALGREDDEFRPFNLVCFDEI